MVHVVETRHTGIINKFLGDGFMALFGIGVDGENHADEALATGPRYAFGARGAQRERSSARGASEMAIGIGIHTGPAIVGSIGSPERLEFTAIGSAVNIASRIEALTKTVKRPLLLTEGTAQASEEASGPGGIPAASCARRRGTDARLFDPVVATSLWAVGRYLW